MTHSKTLLSLACAALMACGGGSNSDVEQPPLDSEVSLTSLTLALTDAEGDFLQYEVDVKSIRLTNTRGDVVDALPGSTRVDFAQYTDVSELVGITQVPTGYYRSAVARVDFSSALIVAQDENGNAIAATAVDAEGNPLGEVDVEIDVSRFENAQGFWLRPGRAARFTLDFDLDASNLLTIDDAGTPDDVSDDSATTEVSPVWVAEPELDTEREHRIRGLLQSADTTASTITLAVRPFHHRTGDFGELTLAVASDAHYEIDQQDFDGEAGLTALAALPADAPLVASGHFVQSEERFVVDTVFAGSSVPWADGEFAKGIVIARDAQTLTLRGVRFAPSAPHGIAIGNDITVNLDENTTVSRVGRSVDHGTHGISIGSRVRIYDEVTGGELHATHVGLLKNQLRARVNTTQDGVVSSELSLFNGLRPDALQWTLAGADPANYRIADSGLPHSLTDGDYLKARGWVSAYDFTNNQTINSFDFHASTLVNMAVDSRGAGLHLHWEDGSAPFVSAGADAVHLSLAGLHKGSVSFAGFRNPLTEDSVVTLVPAQDGRSVFAIADRNEQNIAMFTSFESMSAAAAETVAAGQSLARINAVGQWDEQIGEFTVRRMVMVFASDE
ncbi:DUF4382 domain-containing protein [Simiduia agarivorans]|uniref:DUF4382 domain-containing protein n=1 Tax=Simiduia agarivorans (strain DSM 21679 / JCM 13881 / BCRC 17597 / SA1) TaxID=1117647 RepID=K4KMT6_SIMAS|nr:DUF4382 domain-containing protein [Simiduia agarivorans]AFV00332.1 hypothetical protein M5M_15995 [Simiduia agarivorans SA1 = DSM 21679]